MISPKFRCWTLFLPLLAFISSGKAECTKPKLEGNVVLTDEANLKNEFLDESDVTLECANGYVLDHGSDRITCMGGTWSKQELICKKKDCGMPRPVANMQYGIPNGTLFGAFIKPYCDRGYDLQGSSYRQCLANGWTGRSMCFLKKCAKPTEIHNGMIINHSNKELPDFQDVIQYSCHENYILEGNSSIVCQENGEYSSPPPQCRGKREPASEPTESTPSNFYTNSTLPRLGNESDLRELESTESTLTESTTSNLSAISTPPESQGMVEEASFGQFLTEVFGIVFGILILPSCVFLEYQLCSGHNCGPGILYAIYRHLKRKGSYDTGEALRTKEELLQKHSL
ncbi:sushi, von Willebrand factor type A, EGF and pentraxin domain-containing protein 1 isoform X3 [Electrophorus electricus]|uniref:sushi, von Willebrand factor type A, EGF and pentraxin domain-containing protein 1 isoform X3 n=1 Tax=Electrophorus electricus TaxID=8005 RepID=UPI0015CFD4AD|nr:sushi, von Willebrand factor type A, EGF and pentraxin domain-containing protein 1 isoform X3 [Electrophorus electricus]